MLEETDERTLVHCLWMGVRTNVRQYMSFSRLTPDISSFAECVLTAEIGERSMAQGGWFAGGNNNNGNVNQNHDVGTSSNGFGS